MPQCVRYVRTIGKVARSGRQIDSGVDATGKGTHDAARQARRDQNEKNRHERGCQQDAQNGFLDHVSSMHDNTLAEKIRLAKKRPLKYK